MALSMGCTMKGMAAGRWRQKLSTCRHQVMEVMDGGHNEREAAGRAGRSMSHLETSEQGCWCRSSRFRAWGWMMSC